MKNTVTLVGHVGNNPEVRSTRGDNSITSLSVATSRTYRDAAGNRQTDTEWHRITCFNGVGKAVAEHVKKGALIMVSGRIHYTRWTDQAGADRFGCEIIAEQVDFLVKAKETADSGDDQRYLS